MHVKVQAWKTLVFPKKNLKIPLQAVGEVQTASPQPSNIFFYNFNLSLRKLMKIIERISFSK